MPIAATGDAAPHGGRYFHKRLFYCPIHKIYSRNRI